jgi:hypothetical protein
MLEETLLHKGSAEEWNSVMINEHLPGKPLQHNSIWENWVYIGEMHAWRVRWRVEVTTMHASHLSTCRIHSHIPLPRTRQRLHTSYILDTYIQDELPQRPREQTDLKSSSRLGKDGEW